MGFTTLPTGAAPLYASGHPARRGNLGVISSLDGGQTWTPLSDGVDGPVDFQMMEVSRADAQVLYGAHAGMLQTSRDGGRTWTVVGPTPARLIDVATSARDANILHAGTEAGLLRSTDRGQPGPARIRPPRRSAWLTSGQMAAHWPLCWARALCRLMRPRWTGRS